MSKITNNGLTRSGTGCFMAYPYGNSGRQRVTRRAYSDVQQAVWFASLFLGVTVLLSLTVFLLIVAETMPPTSDAVPLIGQ